ncbi:MAG: endolytic transglycosylase MltG [Lachnospiraceae bacterium]|nr:endolytic transglycosylase MltG [Lachnospiraceae bacterium]
MNFKFFLRGLGAGIIFTAIIMLAAYMTNGSYKMSDEDIMKKAEALGMVTTEENPIVSDTSSENTTDEPSTEKPKTEAPTTEKPSTEDTEEPASTEKPTTEATTEATTQNTTEQAGINTEYTKATITVRSGMGSYEVALLLKDAGIIDNASDFDSYLIRNGYATQIRIKSQEFNSNMSYEEIAKLLVTEE